jgi:hypothetical protein
MSPPHLPRRLAAALAAAACAMLGAATWAGEPAKDAKDAKDYSPAERALFLTDHFSKLHPPLTLRYQFHRTGSLEAAFDDKVAIELKPRSGGSCCDANGEFLSGERKVELPTVEGATGNPVTLFFLERDVREMQRLTKGQSNYFRKRIRLAIYQGAQQRAVTLKFRGKSVPGQEFAITPYVDDPNRPRFEQLAGKRYVFTLSDAVPGGVYAIRTLVANPASGAGAPPLLAEELLIDGAEGSGS